MKDYNEIMLAIQALANGKQPDIDISELLYHHKCFYLLSCIKQPKCSHPAETLLNKVSIRERYHCCQEIFEILKAASIPYAVIKGAVLSAAAYGDPYCRRSGDIDLLINRRDIDNVKRVLLNHGFIQGRITDNGIEPFSRRELLFQSTMSHQIAPFIKATGNKLCPYVNVDINMDIMWGESSRKTDMDFVLSHITQTRIGDTVINKLTPEMEFISLCLHHYKDMNSIYLLAQGSLKLHLLCDIFFYLKRNLQYEHYSDIQSSADTHGCEIPSFNPNLLTALCCQLGVTEYVYYCLYYADLIFDDPILKPLCETFSTPSGMKLLNSYGLSEQERQDWNIEFPELLFNLDIHKYLYSTLSEELLQKIEINKMLM